MTGEYHPDSGWNIWPAPAPIPVYPNYTITWPPQDPRVDDLLARVANLEAEVERLSRRRKKTE
jgi:hypothetical protein